MVLPGRLASCNRPTLHKWTSKSKKQQRQVKELSAMTATYVTGQTQHEEFSSYQLVTTPSIPVSLLFAFTAAKQLLLSIW